MSMVAKKVKADKKAAIAEEKANKEKSVENFMGGISFELNPLDTLKMITASSIFGEPQYYRDGETKSKCIDGKYRLDSLFAPFSVLPDRYEGMKTSDIMENAIDAALDYDFMGTIEWAKTLRRDYFMRLNPQVIMVRAAMHHNRAMFNKQNPGVFAEAESIVMSRADEPSAQLAYYIFKNGGKNNIPNNLKRAWAKKLESLDRYAVNKYKNAELGMIDIVRICHANSDVLNELMRTGNVSIEENENTWETLRSKGMKWREILATTKLGHMALLRNLRGIFTEIYDYDFCEKIMEELRSGVKNGKQFPFRYWQAMKAVREQADINHRQLILDTLEECMDIACDNMPRLHGKTMCLSDNSGSAWNTTPSEYGTVRIAEIDNLSSVIAARNSDEGYIGKFGDRLRLFDISKRQGVLAQANAVSRDADNDIGGGTENGIWLFFDKAIKEKEHWDNIFIFSDMQAGHGGLYGKGEDIQHYTEQGYAVRGRYIDVAKLIDTYRNKVNPEVNVFCIQTAGYNNVLVPEYGYRTNIMYGWTGKETLFADAMNRFWNEKDKEG